MPTRPEQIKMISMNFKALGSRLSAYGLVGFLCAGVYALTLISLEQWMPTWVANPLAFLVASLVGSLGHSRYTFKRETGGNNFARRWVAAQYLINVSVCTVLPLVLPSWTNEGTRLIILVFTPTALNALIWTQAAQFSKHKKVSRTRPLLHADDLGLSHETNLAIYELTRAGKLDGASLLVKAPATEEGAELWAELERSRPEINLCLHLCLTEGPASAQLNLVPDLTDDKGFLHYSFGKWLLLSLLPNNVGFKQKIRQQLRSEIRSQIKLYRALTGKKEIHLDGHQHIHLVPIVFKELLFHAANENIKWIRSTREPLPSGLPLQYWINAFRDAGHLKWIVLQILSIIAIKDLRKNHISTNQRFAGVLFTGQMSILPLKACWQELSSRRPNKNKTASILLAHPGYLPKINLTEAGFSVSDSFATSNKREVERSGLEILNGQQVD